MQVLERLSANLRLLDAIYRAKLLALGLAFLPFFALAQQLAGEPSRPKGGRIEATISPGIALVQAGEDYYLPNADPKFSLQVGGQYEHFFNQAQTVGFRAGVSAFLRTGHYTFVTTDVQRREVLLTIPVELVRRKVIGEHQDWCFIGTAGGYFSELVQRQTYTIDPATAKTVRQRNDWVYGIGGVTASFGVGKQGSHDYNEVGLRVAADVGDYFSQASGGLPNLRYTTLGLYYTFGAGRVQ